MLIDVKPFKLVAVLDGYDNHAEWHLFVDRNDDIVCEIPWPEDWPEYISVEDMEKHGFEIIRA